MVKYGRDKTNNPKEQHGWWGYNLYEGNVWIPLNVFNYFAAIYNNQRITSREYMNMSAKSQARQAIWTKQAVSIKWIQSGKFKNYILNMA